MPSIYLARNSITFWTTLMLSTRPVVSRPFSQVKWLPFQDIGAEGHFFPESSRLENSVPGLKVEYYKCNIITVFGICNCTTGYTFLMGSIGSLHVQCYFGSSLSLSLCQYSHSRGHFFQFFLPEIYNNNNVGHMVFIFFPLRQPAQY